MTESESLARLFPWAPTTDELTRNAVCDAVRARRHMVPLGDLFPLIDPETHLADLALGARIANHLAARHEIRFSAISASSLDDIKTWPYVGANSLVDLVLGLIDSSLRTHAVVASSLAEPTGERAAAAPVWLAGLAADIEVIARWQRLSGTEDMPVLGGIERFAEPHDVRSARARLLALTAAGVLPEAAPGGDAAALVRDAVGDMDDRDVGIIRARLIADRPETLDALGKAYDVTRERIRQLEVKLTKKLTARVRSGELGSLATAARAAVGVVMPLRVLLQRIPTLAEIVEPLGQPVWRVLDRFDDAYEILDGWCAPSSISDAIDRTRRILEAESDNGRYVDLSAVESDLELSDDWLAYAGIPTLRGFAMLGRATIPDRAEVLLADAQAPLRTADLHARLGVERSVTALKNALSADDRFDRVNRDEWALREWGMDGYAPIHTLIRRELELRGGSVDLADLVADLTGRFDISARSVVAYASGFPFTTERGTVRWRTRRDLRVRPRGRGLAQTRGLFRTPTDVRLRVTISTEHLRGSGTPLPNAVGEELDLGIADARELVAPSGAVQLARPRSQVQLGSVRTEANRLSLQEGDVVFFVFGSGGEFSIVPLEAGRTHRDRIIAYAGGQGEGAVVFEELARRIDCQLATVDTVRNALAARGDAELVELIDTMPREFAGVG